MALTSLWHETWPLRSPIAARSWRDGRSLSRQRHAPRPHGCDQGPSTASFDTADWFGDGRQIVYEALTSENEWNVYTQRIDEGPPVLVKAKGHNAVPTLSSDGTTVALHEGNGVSGGIFLYTAGSKPIAAKGVAASEYPVRFVDSGRSLLVADMSGKDVDLTLVDLASGHRKLWKHLSLGVASKRRPLVLPRGESALTHQRVCG